MPQVSSMGQHGPSPWQKAPQPLGKSSIRAASGNSTGLEEIARRLDTLRFKRSFLGLNQQDVWLKVRRLDEMYRLLYRDQDVRIQDLESQVQALRQEREALRREVQRLRKAGQ